ncbi:hypothetical protein FRB99_001606 [Tulasnella sp. 403]|nr:hypothetical protein FRB99_001606 [Tulasnella sp. 403]
MSKKSPLIAVDFDDVLVATNQSAAQWHNREFGSTMTLDDFLYYHWWKNPYWGSMKETFTKVLNYYKADDYRHAPPVQDAFRCCKQLKAMGYRLIVLTARSDEHRQLTEDAIQKYFPGTFDTTPPRGRSLTHYFIDLLSACRTGIFDGLEFTASIAGRGSAQVTKAQMLRNLGASLLIDDSLDNCIDCAKTGLPIMLFGHYEWNKRTSTVHARIEDSMGFEEREGYESARGTSTTITDSPRSSAAGSVVKRARRWWERDDVPDSALPRGVTRVATWDDVVRVAKEKLGEQSP